MVATVSSHEHQDLWDKMMLDSWRLFGKMGGLVFLFLKGAGIEVEGNKVLQALKGLRRTPIAAPHMRKPVRAYVHDHLPRLSHALWDDATDERALEIMKSLDTYTNPNETSKWHYKRNMAYAYRFVDQNKAFRRRDGKVLYTTCKSRRYR